MTYDKSLDKQLIKSYQEQFKIKNNISIDVYFKIGEYPRIQYKDICITGDVKCEKANKNMKDRILEQIKKTGNTLFNITRINETVFEDVYYPIAKINELRRKLIDEIYKSKKTKINTKTIENIILPTIKKENKKKISIFFYKYRKDIDYTKLEVDIIYLPIESKNMIKDDRIIYWVEENNKATNNTLVSNIGLLDKKNSIDYGMNVFNPWTLFALEKINTINTVAASAELSEIQLKDLINKTKYLIEVVVYGKLIAMKSKYCINGALYKKGECKTKNIIIDNKDNNTYEVVPYCSTCTSYILDNNKVDYLNRSMDGDILRINIKDEKLSDIVKIIEKLKNNIIQN